MGKAAARRVTSGHVHRNQFLSGNNTGMQFRFKFKHTLPLLFGKIVDLLMGKLNIVFCLLVHAVGRLIDIVLGDDELTGPVVRLLGILSGHIGPVRFVCVTMI